MFHRVLFWPTNALCAWQFIRVTFLATVFETLGFLHNSTTSGSIACDTAWSLGSSRFGISCGSACCGLVLSDRDLWWVPFLLGTWICASWVVSMIRSLGNNSIWPGGASKSYLLSLVGICCILEMATCASHYRSLPLL